MNRIYQTQQNNSLEGDFEQNNMQNNSLNGNSEQNNMQSNMQSNMQNNSLDGNSQQSNMQSNMQNNSLDGNSQQSNMQSNMQNNSLDGNSQQNNMQNNNFDNQNVNQNEINDSLQNAQQQIHNLQEQSFQNPNDNSAQQNQYQQNQQNQQNQYQQNQYQQNQQQQFEQGQVKKEEINLPPIPYVTIDVFCVDRNTADTISKISQDRRIQKATINIEDGGIPSAIRKYRSEKTPNLIIVECNEQPEFMIQLLGQLSEYCDEKIKVLVIGNYNDVTLYRELIDKGVSDYIVSPVSPMQMLDFIANLYGKKSNKKIGKVVSFISAKGGIGSSTISHNVAWTVAELLREKIALVDLDLGFGSASLDLNKDIIQSIFEALQAPDRFDSVLLERLLTQCTEYLSLFASPVSLEHDYDFKEESLINIIDVLRENMPYSLLDLPHEWNSWIKKCLVHSDDIYIITAPELVSLRNARNLRERMIGLRENDSPPKIILSPVGMPKRPEVHIDDIRKAIGAGADYSIKFDPENFGKASNDGLMINQLDSKLEVNNTFTDIAMAITGKKTRPKNTIQNSNLMSMFGSLIKRKKTANG